MKRKKIIWVWFLTNGNADGVPCTIVRVEGKRMKVYE